MPFACSSRWRKMSRPRLVPAMMGHAAALAGWARHPPCILMYQEAGGHPLPQREGMKYTPGRGRHVGEEPVAISHTSSGPSTGKGPGLRQSASVCVCVCVHRRVCVRSREHTHAHAHSHRMRRVKSLGLMCSAPHQQSPRAFCAFPARVWGLGTAPQ